MTLIHRRPVKSRAWPLAIALLFLLGGCQKNHWKHAQIDGANRDSYSTKISKKASDNPYVEFELIKTCEGQKGYLIFHLDRICGTEGNPDAISATIIDQSQNECTFTAARMRGGQRILLPKEMTSMIIANLSNKQSVQIFLGDYGINISYEGIEEALKKLNAPQNSLKLPNIAMDWSTN